MLIIAGKVQKLSTTQTHDGGRCHLAREPIFAGSVETSLFRNEVLKVVNLLLGEHALVRLGFQVFMLEPTTDLFQPLQALRN